MDHRPDLSDLSATERESTAESVAAISAGRYGDPEEYGQTVTFRTSTGATHLNGSVIRVDGGYLSST